MFNVLPSSRPLQMLYIAETFTGNSIDLEYVWSARIVRDTVCSTEGEYDTQILSESLRWATGTCCQGECRARGGHAIEAGTLAVVK